MPVYIQKLASLVNKTTLRIKVDFFCDREILSISARILLVVLSSEAVDMDELLFFNYISFLFFEIYDTLYRGAFKIDRNGSVSVFLISMEWRKNHNRYRIHN